MQTSNIAILWDASHLWGLMLWRTLASLGIPCHLLKAEIIAKGCLLGKSLNSSDPTRDFLADNHLKLLLVPGGNAKQKAQALGTNGMQAICSYVSKGGFYLGFCGGAGLALSHENGLGLCQWHRAKHSDRIQHLMSGHVQSKLQISGNEQFFPDSWQDNDLVELPIWWPGRFHAEKNSKVQILASYQKPAQDFWLVDLPLAKIPQTIIEMWQDCYALDFSANNLMNQPLVLTGEYGNGRYILSYSHLETPQSPSANLWLIHLLQNLVGIRATTSLVPSWDLHHEPVTAQAWPKYIGETLARLCLNLRSLFALAVEHRLFFPRTSWLWGWKAGLPGSACNNLYAALHLTAQSLPTPKAIEFWNLHQVRIQKLSDLFLSSAEGYFLNCRLAETLMPKNGPLLGLTDQHDNLFGHSMHGGGLLGELLGYIEELFYLCHSLE